MKAKLDESDNFEGQGQQAVALATDNLCGAQARCQRGSHRETKQREHAYCPLYSDSK
jgi:hypothetical protein